MKKKNELSNEKLGKVTGGRGKPKSAPCPWCTASILIDSWENHVNKGYGCTNRPKDAEHKNFPN